MLHQPPAKQNAHRMNTLPATKNVHNLEKFDLYHPDAKNIIWYTLTGEIYISFQAQSRMPANLPALRQIIALAESQSTLAIYGPDHPQAALALAESRRHLPDIPDGL